MPRGWKCHLTDYFLQYVLQYAGFQSLRASCRRSPEGYLVNRLRLGNYRVPSLLTVPLVSEPNAARSGSRIRRMSILRIQNAHGRELMNAAHNPHEKPLTSLPKIVSRPEWQQALEQFLVKEKAATRAKDALNAERRRLPMVQIEKNYVFDGPGGKVSLLDLFEGRRQLIIYHFMFAPDVEGWPTAGCEGCSMVVDHMGPVEHLHARDTSLVLVSLGPLAALEAYKKRMGWKVPWVSSAGTSFNAHFGLSTNEGERFGLSTFLRDGDAVYQTYFVTDRGVEPVDTNFALLDWTVLGRQETWEDSPPSWPQTEPYVWWRRHDEY